MLPELEQLFLRSKGVIWALSPNRIVSISLLEQIRPAKRDCEFITQHFSEDVILAEEAGEQFIWILDPIDGTTNFANALPIWGISIGLMQHSKMIGGLVSALGLGRRYCAVSGKGATCNLCNRMSKVLGN